MWHLSWLRASKELLSSHPLAWSLVFSLLASQLAVSQFTSAGFLLYKNQPSFGFSPKQEKAGMHASLFIAKAHLLPRSTSGLTLQASWLFEIEKRLVQGAPEFPTPSTFHLFCIPSFACKSHEGIRAHLSHRRISWACQGTGPQFVSRTENFRQATECLSLNPSSSRNCEPF